MQADVQSSNSSQYVPEEHGPGSMGGLLQGTSSGLSGHAHCLWASEPVNSLLGTEC